MADRHCYGASMPLTAYTLLHLRWVLPRTRVLSLQHIIVLSNGAAPDTGTLLRPDALVRLLSAPQLCLNHAAAIPSERRWTNRTSCLSPYHCHNSIAGPPSTVPEKALGWFPCRATVVSKRQREYLREMGYKVNRDDDNGDGATKQDALPLTPPVFGRLRRK